MNGSWGGAAVAYTVPVRVWPLQSRVTPLLFMVIPSLTLVSDRSFVSVQVLVEELHVPIALQPPPVFWSVMELLDAPCAPGNTVVRVARVRTSARMTGRNLLPRDPFLSLFPSWFFVIFQTSFFDWVLVSSRPSSALNREVFPENYMGLLQGVLSTRQVRHVSG